MNIKGVVVKENFTELLTPPAPIEESEGGNRVLVGAKKNRPRNAVFSLIVFPLVPGAVKTLGGFLGLSANLPNHELWKAQTVEEGYRLFEDNFPQAKIRECISEEQMATFVQTRPSVFCPITRRDSLAFRVGEPAQGGVLVMGDAAHSFPPDLGQGVNSAFEDVAVFTDLLDGFSNDTSLDTVLKEYEARRDADTTALTKIARVAAPYQYGQNKLGSMLSVFNRNGRDKLTKLLPNFFYPAMITLVYSDIPYSCILSRTNATTLRIWLLAASLVVGPLASVLFLSGLAQ
ncbi:unnamed protein product [Chondrus crispus]|uniref:FAD-binding domain-containing protein n=1 Tax=Chondrus crispus TaxID=2769 RepID=R7QFQ9_CHOCR|nr:unnamed protein product [Chondrus crispus]CDF36588.1 unnamed protein product [Chondrus crispus]|eukprot:XP_005716407.1 unnamed protein product [Chondrus crispus]